AGRAAHHRCRRQRAAGAGRQRVHAAAAGPVGAPAPLIAGGNQYWTRTNTDSVFVMIHEDTRRNTKKELPSCVFVCLRGFSANLLVVCVHPRLSASSFLESAHGIIS